MDDLTLLRELANDPPPLTQDARDAALARLRREIATAGGPPTPRRRRRSARMVLAVAAIVTTAVAAVGVIVWNVDISDSGRLPTQLASAAPVLHRAALQARTEAPLSWRDDQYLYTREVMSEIPIDARGTTLTFTNEYWRSADGSKPSRVIERGRTWTEAPFADGSVWPPRRYAALTQLPTEPEALLDAILDWFGRGNTAADDHESQYMGLTMLLDRELPPALRAATFEALARIPGVEVLDEQVDARGRRGIGIARPTDPAKPDLVIVLSPDSYEFLGTRERSARNDGTRIHLLLTLEERAVVDRIDQRP